MTYYVSPQLSLNDIEFLIALPELFDDGARMAHVHSLKDVVKEIEKRGIAIPGIEPSEFFDRLEEMLGGEEAKRKLLLRRTKGRPELTHKARELAKELVQLRRLFKKRIVTRIKSLRRRVNIGLTNSVTMNLLPRVLRAHPEFLHEYDDLDLKVVEGESAELARDVHLGRIDFAIAPQERPHGCDAEPLSEWNRVLLFNLNTEYKNDFAEYSRTKPATDVKYRILRSWLQQESLIIPPRHIMPELEDRFLRYPTTGRRFKLPQASLRRAWVEKGLGVAITHEEQETVQEGSNLGSIDLSSALGKTRLYLYFPRSKGRPSPLSDAAQALVDLIRKVMGTAPSKNGEAVAAL